MLRTAAPTRKLAGGRAVAAGAQAPNGASTVANAIRRPTPARAPATGPRYLETCRSEPVGCPPVVNRRPQLQIVAPNASPEEAAAVVAALERFMRDTAPPPAPTGPGP